MPDLSTWPSSITSPVRISLVAASTDAGFMWLAEPRSSPAPHLEGQRSLSAGGFQVWAPAVAGTISRAVRITNVFATFLMFSSLVVSACEQDFAPRLPVSDAEAYYRDGGRMMRA